MKIVAEQSPLSLMLKPLFKRILSNKTVPPVIRTGGTLFCLFDGDTCKLSGRYFCFPQP